jgi:phosphoenolpyruvate carboxykinase (GTP)
MGRQAPDSAKLPRIYHVNWFRKDEEGRFLWPGFGENSRVLAWIFRRCEGRADAVDTPAGRVPAEGAIDTDGLDVEPEAMRKLLSIDPEGIREELPTIHEHYAQFGDRLPDELRTQLEELERRLSA